MSNQELHDDIENLVEQIRNIIPPLKMLMDGADKGVSERLNKTLNKVDVKTDDLAVIVQQLKRGLSITSDSLVNLENQAMKSLEKGVKLFVESEIGSRYDKEIAKLIDATIIKINSDIEVVIQRLSERKERSIDKNDEAVQQNVEALKIACADANASIADSILILNQASNNLLDKSTKNINELVDIANGHTQALQDFNKQTSITLMHTEKHLEKVSQQVSFLTLSPVVLIVIITSVFNLSFLFAFTYKYQLGKYFAFSLLAIVILISIFGMGYHWLKNYDDEN